MFDKNYSLPQKPRKYRILSIDAWAGSEPMEWEWNNWFHVGSIDKIPDSDDAIIQLFIDEGYLKPTAKDKVWVEDDQYNFVIRVKKDHCPLWAIEYGNER